MAAPKNNKNAEKWTIQESEKFLNSVFEYVKKNKECTSLAEACSELDEYEELLYYIINKYNNINFKSIKKAKDIIKKRLMKNGLINKYNPTMCIFILKTNHGMVEKNEIDLNHKTNSIPLIDFFNTNDKDK